MKLGLISILAIGVLAGCAEGVKDSPDQQAVVSEENKDVSNKYQRFEGTIAGKPVVLQLVRYGARIAASYYYEAHGKIIGLYCQRDTSVENGYLVDEMPDVADAAEQPHWQMVLDAHTIKGKWLAANGKKSYDIDLKEAFPPGSYSFRVFNRADSISYRAGKPEPAATLSWTWLLPADDVDKQVAEFMTNTIMQALGCDTLQATTPDVCVKKQSEAYAVFYRESLQGLEDTMLAMEMNNYYSSSSMSLVYNAHDWISLAFDGSEYTGGAHGMYYSRYVNMDAATLKIWTISDVIKVDSTRITALLEKEAARYFNTGDIKDLLLVDHIPVTGNFFATHGGLTFHYDPYEIMPYAAGSVDLFIPYGKIREWLTPDFKKRMNLN